MIKFSKYIKDNYILLIFSFFIFVYVAYISNKTPLAGDDWAFFNNSMNSTVINSAISMYYNWEGRLMTLFSIHFFIMNRNIWELLNAFIYTGVFISIYLIIKPNRKILFSSVFLFLMLSMKENIRMEVMTWITGSVYYGIPLLLSFVYCVINYNIYENKHRKNNVFLIIMSSSIAFYLPLGMENISIAMLVASLSLIVLSYLQDKKIPLVYYFNIFMFIIGYLIWMNSPGSSIRLSQMPEWNQLSFIGKIMQTMPNVLFFTFYQNKVIIIALGLSLFLLNLQKNVFKYNWLFDIIYFISIIIMLSQRLNSIFPNIYLLELIADPYSIFNIVFWIIYAVTLVLNIIKISMINKSNKILLLLLITIFTNASLLMSPVIGYRLMIYSVFYLFALILLILNELEFKIKLEYVGVIVLLILSLYLANKTISKFKVVESITNERFSIISDYKVYSEFYKDGIWLPRYPIYSIHGGDIELEDQYHMKAFKEYFDIPQEEIITFYWKDNY